MSSVRWKKHPCTRTLETFCCADIAQLIWTFARPGTVNELVASAAPAIERARDVSLPEHMTRLQLRKRAERAMHHLAPVMYSFAEFTSERQFVDIYDRHDQHASLGLIANKLVEYFPYVSRETQTDLLYIYAMLGVTYHADLMESQ